MHDDHLPKWRPHSAGHLLIEALIVTFAFLVAACATPRLSPAQDSDPIPLEARVVNTYGHSVPVNDAGADPTLALGAIPGEIRGNPTRTLQYVHIADSPAIAINTNALRAAMLKELSTEADDFLISGLSVEPADTRFARVSTIFMKKGAPIKGIAAGFIEPELMSPLTLFYFDRPCRVTGVISGDDGGASPITYEVDVATAGLTWLVEIQNENGGPIVRVANEPIRKMFVAAPADNLKNGRFQIR